MGSAANDLQSLVQVPGYHHTTQGVQDYCPTIQKVEDGSLQTDHEASCKNCMIYRRPCAWLDNQTLARRDGRYKFLKVPIKDLRGVQDISGPSRIAIMENGPIAEEYDVEAGDDVGDVFDDEFEG